MLRVLRQRNFALLWFGGLISLAGDWVLYAALPFFVYQRTGSTVATAGMIVAELGPGAVVGSFAGVYVDRLDRRRILVTTNLLQAVTVGLLLFVVDGSRMWIVYAVAAAQALLASFSAPAESALLPALVGSEDLLAANALTTLNNRLARLLGVPLGGVLLGLFGLGPVVVTDACSFLLAALIISGVRLPPRDRVVRLTRVSADWLDGVRLVGRDRALATLFWVLALMTFGGTMIDPLYVAWVRDVLKQGPKVFGLLLATQASAGIAGSLLVGHYRARLAPRFLIGWSSIAAGAALIAKWNLPFLAAAFALTAAGGIFSVASAIGVETWIQSAVSDAYRGRVFAALGASGAFASLAGAVVAGVTARAVGVTTMLNISAFLIAGAGAIVLRHGNQTSA